MASILPIIQPRPFMPDAPVVSTMLFKTWAAFTAQVNPANTASLLNYKAVYYLAQEASHPELPAVSNEQPLQLALPDLRVNFRKSAEYGRLS
tara:strand:- start:60 stop:335 length:276 start_codon:yes stop_codon:yes gene_type:complete